MLLDHQGEVPPQEVDLLVGGWFKVGILAAGRRLQPAEDPGIEHRTATDRHRVATGHTSHV